MARAAIGREMGHLIDARLDLAVTADRGDETVCPGACSILLPSSFMTRKKLVLNHYTV